MHICILLCLVSFTQRGVSKIHSFLSLAAFILWLPQLVYPLSCWWILGLYQIFGYYEHSYHKLSWISLFGGHYLHFSWVNHYKQNCWIKGRSMGMFTFNLDKYS
jgi:hypothetical protein